jgi:hypothetical protein
MCSFISLFSKTTIFVSVHQGSLIQLSGLKFADSTMGFNDDEPITIAPPNSGPINQNLYAHVADDFTICKFAHCEGLLSFSVIS